MLSGVSFLFSFLLREFFSASSITDLNLSFEGEQAIYSFVVVGGFVPLPSEPEEEVTL